jgi:hypothetical protein
MFFIVGCAYRVTGVVNSYEYDAKTIEKMKRDSYDCSAVSKILYNSEQAKRYSASASDDYRSTLIFLDVLNLVYSEIPDSIEVEYNKCMESKGWYPKFQFINTNYLKSSDKFDDAFEICRTELNDDALLLSVMSDQSYIEKFLEDDASIEVYKKEKMDLFAVCLIKNGWWLITQPPWYVKSQKLNNIVRFIPRGKWSVISSDEKYNMFCDHNKIIKNGDVIAMKILKVPKIDSDPQVGIFNVEIDCKVHAFRESSSRRFLDIPWSLIQAGTHVDIWHNKLCK